MILDNIVSCKKAELSRLKGMYSMKDVEELLPGLPPTRQLKPALRRPGQVAIIAETKKASPSKGIISREYHPVTIARAYEQAGAAAVSVLTEEKFFLGHSSHLTFVREAVAIPVLRKDFIIDPYQIYESRVLGADAVLLITAILSLQQLIELKKLSTELGMSCLVEVHTESELYRALSAGAEIIGINNRNLNTFETDLNNTFQLLEFIDKQDLTVVSESGIKSRADLIRLQDGGVHAALIGETLMRSRDPGAGLLELTGSSGPLERGSSSGSL